MDLDIHDVFKMVDQRLSLTGSPLACVAELLHDFGVTDEHTEEFIETAVPAVVMSVLSDEPIRIKEHMGAQESVHAGVVYGVCWGLSLAILSTLGENDSDSA